ncbi:hypothetical protein FAZ15_21365 [Sphingobacterium olei]|uniref:Uncharacterized protein n=1 Tax=Sphingobacterium olei TaxID=2571155 RepID=A0A4U0NA98_9SPHI|nr:hypothetical protein [Sphingobacterium olei]TJZ50573.1 hypothetical protein FAZ15_21365 [Sphingobacterium olei]
MYLFKIGLVVLLFGGLTSCAEFIEYPLEEEQVALVAPMNNLETTDSVIAFWWEHHEDAKYYRFQLVSPNFEEIRAALIDSLTYDNKIELILKPGKYSWRVRPENDGSAGQYQYRELEIVAE